MEDSRNISPNPNRPDTNNLNSAFLAERGEKKPAASLPRAPRKAA